MAVAASAAALALGLAACGGDSDDDTGSASGSGSGESVQVAHFTAFLGSPFEQASLAASKAEAAKLGGKVTNFDAGNDPQKQLQQCQDAIATQKYKAFVIKPVDGAAAQPCARQAVDAGIKVVALDTPIGPDVEKVEPQVQGVSGSVVSLPSTYGTALADMTIQACEGKTECKVAYLFGPPAFSFVANSRKVFKEAVAEHSNIKIVAEDTTEFVPDTALSVTKQILQKTPDVDVITDDDDATAVAISKLLKSSPDTSKITLIGGGGAKEAVDLIKKGDILGTAVLAPESEARRAVEIAIQSAQGKTVEGETALDGVSKLIKVGTYVTKDNAADFTPEWSTSG